MSNVFIREIDGVNDFAIPESDTDLSDATTALDALVSGVADLTYETLLAWVETKDGTSPTRTLNALVQTFEYETFECPTTAKTETMTDDIETALLADADISGVGEQQVSLFQLSSVQPWIRDPGGFVYPTNVTDDIYIGGATPNGRWKESGELVLGGSSFVGLEMLRVVGPVRIEGKLSVTGLIDPPSGLVLEEQASKPDDPTGTTEGVIWVKDDNPNTLYFTDNAGADHQLGAGGASPWQRTGTVINPATGTDDVAIGATTMRSNERMRILNVTEGAEGGFLAEQVIPATAFFADWFGFKAHPRNDGDASSGTVHCFEVGVPVGGSYNDLTGFYYPSMTGSPGAGSTAFHQAGADEFNTFAGRTGFGSTDTGTVPLRTRVNATANSQTQSWRMFKAEFSNVSLPSSVNFLGYDVEGAATGGTLTSYIGFRVQGFQRIGGADPTVTDCDGIHIENLQADGNVTFTNTPFGIRQSGASDINYFAGNTGVGVSPTTGAQLEVSQSFTGSENLVGALESAVSAGAGTVGTVYGIKSEATILTTFTPTAIVGVNSKAEAAGSAGATSVDGFRADLVVGTGSVTGLTGLEVSASLGASGSVSSYRGLHVLTPSSSGGTYSNVYGVLVEAQNSADVINPWGIYQSGSSDQNYFAGKIGIGTSVPATSAMVDIQSTTGALIVSRMSTAQRNALTAVDGMIIYNTSTTAFNFRENGAWVTGSGLA
jgi:hypothetical protein